MPLNERKCLFADWSRFSNEENKIWRVDYSFAAPLGHCGRGTNWNDDQCLLQGRCWLFYFLWRGDSIDADHWRSKMETRFRFENDHERWSNHSMCVDWEQSNPKQILIVSSESTMDRFSVTCRKRVLLPTQITWRILFNSMDLLDGSKHRERRTPMCRKRSGS